MKMEIADISAAQRSKLNRGWNRSLNI